MSKKLMKGNEAIAEAAVRAGCRFFFGYPITPQNQIPEYMSKRLPEVGGVFLQAESEIAAINMVYGTSGAGKRVMTSSSSPGISLKQEGISYIAGAELPAVIVNIMRCGPGLGGILPSQSDYFQATRGGGHGDYRTIVLAPAGVQEACDLTYKAFDLADKYRMPVVVLGDGMIGQMMESVELPEFNNNLPSKPWATTGANGGEKRLINSLYIEAEELEKVNMRLLQRYSEIEQKEVMYEQEMIGDASFIVTAYGTVARLAKKAVKLAREKGVKVGLIRPITLWPFPNKPFRELAGLVKCCLTVEMSCGQMVDDVRLAVNGAYQVRFYGRTGGVIPSVNEILDQIL
ncbi:MAG TPA: 3-methyl-2-oxobutanoate dehydrogenase subunit VorB, partial [Clostridia bacterium]|nr:3-methyl-2-oxobutanoate dehydrogenase subunit VorB [Clostridia bacterium]